MRDVPRRLCLTGVFLGLAVILPSARAQSWSPDGSWLAYVLTVRPAPERMGWLLGDEPADRPEGIGETRYRLWTTRVASEESVLLFESDGPLSTPAWSPDGTALAFGHISEGPDRPARFEVVIQDAPDRRRVLRSWTLDGPAEALDGLDACAISWSADGDFLAVSGLPSGGLAVLEVANGRIARELPGGSRPVWAPEGDRLAFVGTGDPPGLDLLTMATGQVRRLAEIPGLDRLPAPVWSREGDALLVMAFLPEVEATPRPDPGRATRPGVIPTEGPVQAQLRIDRVGLARGDRDPVQMVQHEPFADFDDLLWSRFDLDRQGSELFYSTTVRDGHSLVTWVGIPNHETVKRYNPLQAGMPIRSLTISPSPTRRELALCFDLGDRISPPALSDPRNDATLQLLTPDDDARADWLETLLAAMARELEGSFAMSDDVPALPTRLPAPGELEENDPRLIRLRQLAETGRRICEGLAEPHEGNETGGRQALLDEARLAFAYFPDPTDDPDADYAPALAALDAFERHADSPEERSRLLGLRAQIAMARKEYPRAEAILEHLRDATARSGRRIEETARGPVLEPADPSGGWPQALSSRLDDLKHGRATSPLMIGPDADDSDPTEQGPALEPGVNIVIPPIAPPELPAIVPPNEVRIAPGLRVVPDNGRR